ncbi:protein-glutamine gamma-glutamyltransferase [Paenibacillus antarcticus]|uniref:Protein-glutamine gamma-glutamyltransferase n=1 Tax=Paenibacillus antarcticus TaxID=253703 RepID=A0A168MP86_9BACL|nr:protein-glutamine gamma-glutamyltransferase [Paenibacillus antarcticus]OAB44902.1 protein-glutamine gamma-glutamyltransferase [Paenibacillus antarcticus]
MIVITGVDIEQINTLQLTDVERDIVNQKKKSERVYRYVSLEALDFELKMRTATIDAGKALKASEAKFAVFKNSRCNNEFWTRTDNGGFRLNSGMRPSVGINDIFKNGQLYGFECATAMIITLYKATLTVLKKDIFDVYFQDLYLRDWNYDSDLQLRMVEHNNEVFPGDIVYFKNPDHNPATPEWQGENAVYLGNGLYFGHGMGIKPAEGSIASLNKRRIPGSTTSAYLTDEVVHPDYEYLRKLSTSRYRPLGNHQHHMEDTIVARIGMHMYRVNSR